MVEGAKVQPNGDTRRESFVVVPRFEAETGRRRERDVPHGQLPLHQRLGYEVGCSEMERFSPSKYIMRLLFLIHQVRCTGTILYACHDEKMKV